MLTITANKRETSADNQKIRNEGKVPAVFYGPKENSTSIVMEEVDFMKVFREAGESAVVALKFGSDEHETLIHAVQWDPVTQKPLHVDFYVIEKGKKVEVAVPLEFVGESEAVLKLGGVLVKVMYEVDIEAMPKDLPQNIEVDISSLVDFESQIKASDLKIPAGVELITELEEVVALVQEHKEEEEAPVEIDLDSIEVEGEKPESDEEKEGEEPKKDTKKDGEDK